MDKDHLHDCLWLRNAVSLSDLEALDGTGTKGRPGARVVDLPDAALAALKATENLIAQKALPGARLVRVVWFSKDADANWGVPWHQDRIIAVSARHAVPGYTNWSEKHGLWHCEPPMAVLNDMRFVRLHLDDCDARNGAMQIAVGSHSVGAVKATDAESTALRYPVEICEARRGDVQVLPMLTLHRSLPAEVPASRRVLRLDFAATDLPPPLGWAMQLAP